jgi:mevalonate kinase
MKAMQKNKAHLAKSCGGGKGGCLFSKKPHHLNKK